MQFFHSQQHRPSQQFQPPTALQCVTSAKEQTLVFKQQNKFQCVTPVWKKFSRFWRPLWTGTDFPCFNNDHMESCNLSHVNSCTDVKKITANKNTYFAEGIQQVSSGKQRILTDCYSQILVWKNSFTFFYFSSPLY